MTQAQTDTAETGAKVPFKHPSESYTEQVQILSQSSLNGYKRLFGGWHIQWVPALGYYDAVNHARRIKCPVQIEAGLSDWVCPPSGVWCLYNVLPGSKRMKMFQGRNHGPYFGYDQNKAPFVEVNQQ